MPKELDSFHNICDWHLNKRIQILLGFQECYNMQLLTIYYNTTYCTNDCLFVELLEDSLRLVLFPLSIAKQAKSKTLRLKQRIKRCSKHMLCFMFTPRQMNTYLEDAEAAAEFADDAGLLQYLPHRRHRGLLLGLHAAARHDPVIRAPRRCH